MKSWHTLIYTIYTSLFNALFFSRVFFCCYTLLKKKLLLKNIYLHVIWKSFWNSIKNTWNGLKICLFFIVLILVVWWEWIEAFHHAQFNLTNQARQSFSDFFCWLVPLSTLRMGRKMIKNNLSCDWSFIVTASLSHLQYSQHRCDGNLFCWSQITSLKTYLLNLPVMIWRLCFRTFFERNSENTGK